MRNNINSSYETSDFEQVSDEILQKKLINPPEINEDEYIDRFFASMREGIIPVTFYEKYMICITQDGLHSFCLLMCDENTIMHIFDINDAIKYHRNTIEKVIKGLERHHTIGDSYNDSYYSNMSVIPAERRRIFRLRENIPQKGRAEFYGRLGGYISLPKLYEDYKRYWDTYIKDLEEERHRNEIAARDEKERRGRRKREWYNMRDSYWRGRPTPVREEIAKILTDNIKEEYVAGDMTLTQLFTKHEIKEALKKYEKK